MSIVNNSSSDIRRLEVSSEIFWIISTIPTVIILSFLILTKGWRLGGINYVFTSISILVLSKSSTLLFTIFTSRSFDSSKLNKILSCILLEKRQINSVSSSFHILHPPSFKTNWHSKPTEVHKLPKTIIKTYWLFIIGY